MKNVILLADSIQQQLDARRALRLASSKAEQQKAFDKMSSARNAGRPIYGNSFSSDVLKELQSGLAFPIPGDWRGTVAKAIDTYIALAILHPDIPTLPDKGWKRILDVNEPSTDKDATAALEQLREVLAMASAKDNKASANAKHPKRRQSRRKLRKGDLRLMLAERMRANHVNADGQIIFTPLTAVALGQGICEKTQVYDFLQEYFNGINAYKSNCRAQNSSWLFQRLHRMNPSHRPKEGRLQSPESYADPKSSRD